MGLDVNGVQCILYAQSLGVDFSRTATIGRQGLHLKPADFKANLRRFGFTFSENTIDRIYTKENGYADEFFRRLGASLMDSFDNSAYEGATQLHDMNQEIPQSLKLRYTAVVDSGSLEHVFNFPVALRNCMEMVEVGGHYVAITPANNFMGHGFYQFSPELFFAAFTPANGFEMVSAIAFEDNAKSAWYAVKSPAVARRRITLTNSTAVYLFVIAKRISDVTPFTVAPQQTDYVSAWSEAPASADGTTAGVVSGTKHLSNTSRGLIRHAPDWMKRIAKRVLRVNRGWDLRFFHSIERTDGSGSPEKTLERAG